MADETHGGLNDGASPDRFSTSRDAAAMNPCAVLVDRCGPIVPAV